MRSIRRPDAPTRAGQREHRTRLELVGFVVGVGLAALGVLGTGCPSPPSGPRYMGAGSDTPQRGGTFIFHHESDVRGFDPHISFDELSTMGIKLLFEGLLEYDNDAQIVPRLAEAMPTLSEDGRTYRFRLKQGVRFHDIPPVNGRELVAEDVRWSLEHMLDPDIGSPGFTFYTNIEGIDEYRAKTARHISGIHVLDRYTVEIQLKAADQTFIHAMAMQFANPVPHENYEMHPDDISQHPIGTGAYILESWEPGMRVTFRRNDRFFMEGRPYPDRQVFELNLDRNAAVMRFRNGEIDVIHRQTLDDYRFFREAEAWQPYMEIKPHVDAWGIFMNCQLPPFDNVHVRRAVAFAVDRDRWNRARRFRLELLGQPIPAGLLGHDPNLPGQHHYDLAAARQEMRLAGHPNGLDEPVTLWIGEGAISRAYGELAQADLARIGISLELKPVSFAVFLRETGKPRTAQALISGWQQDFPDPADFLDILFHTRAIHEHDSENKSFYSNPEVDALLDQARVERDVTARGALYRQASEIIVRDAPWAFVFSNRVMHVWQPYVHDYHVHPVYSNLYRDVWLDLPRRRLASRFENPAARMASSLPLGRFGRSLRELGLIGSDR